MFAMRAHRADDRLGAQAGQSTICVCVTNATSAPASVRMRVCQTDYRLPIFTCVASPTSSAPTGPAPRKLVLLSIVAVLPAPSGKVWQAPTAPRQSAQARIAQPSPLWLPVQVSGTHTLDDQPVWKETLNTCTT